MRIGGGSLGGRRVRVPRGVRPTGGRARSALFDVWAPRLGESRFLDLFAGSGAVGIEAIGRGAASLVAVEGSRAAARVLRANCEELLPTDRWRVVGSDLLAALERGLDGALPFDLVFADPPYDFADWSMLLIGIAGVLAADGEAAIEHGRRNRPPETAGGLTRSQLRPYGETELSFYARTSAVDGGS